MAAKEKNEHMTNRNMIIVVGALVMLDVLAWSSIAFGSFGKQLELFFFDVGQGDSEMIVMPGGVKMLIDGGPDNGKAAESLGRVLPWRDRYIDVVMVSHLELDHFGGLMDVIRRYDVGAFVYNGRAADSESARKLMIELGKRKVPMVIVGAGDKVAYGANVMDIVSARGDMIKKTNANESAIVARFTGGGMTALFTGDIGKSTEKLLARTKKIKADVIKIPHHGSKFSSTEEFLKTVRPKIAIIEVGKNSYGHPTKEALERIKNVKARLFRTDINGMVQLIIENGTIKQLKEK